MFGKKKKIPERMDLIFKMQKLDFNSEIEMPD